MLKILVIGDDATTAQALERGLVRHKHEVTLALGDLDRVEALRADVDACVLDLHRSDVRALLERARRAGIRTPILRLSEPQRDVEERLGRPFDLDELIARLDALLRRQPRRTRAGELELGLASRRARIGSRELSLSRKQFALLAFFVQHAGEVVTRTAVLKRVFGYDFDPGTNIVDVHVAHLRTKLGDADRLRITTVRGRGYRLEP